MVAVCALGVLLLLADGLWVTLQIRGELRAAKTELEQGAGHLTDGDAAAAGTAFHDAARSAAAAAGVLGHPAAKLAGLFPFFKDDVEAVRSLASAALLTADAGDEIIGAAAAAGWDGKGIPGFTSAESFDLAPLQAASPGIARASDLLHRAELTLRSIDTGHLFGAVRDAVAQAEASISQRARETDRVVQVTRLLPGLLGADGPRAYLLVTLQSSDPRGGGGYPGQFAVLHTDGHGVKLEKFAPTSTIPTVEPVNAPPDVVHRYGSFGATRFFKATTYSPDFPTDASLMLEIWQAAGRPPLDGVIAVDSVFMSYALGVLGPVQAPGWPEAITAGNVQQVVGRDVYLTTVQEQSDSWEAAVGTALVQAILQRPWPLSGMAAATSRAADEKHLQVYSTDAAEQDLLHSLGTDGAVRLSDDPPLVTLDGIVDARTGYFAKHTVETSTQENPDGSRTVTVTVTVTNTAPTGPPSILLGSKGGGYPVGSFAATVSVYLPVDAKVESNTVDGELGVQILQYEFGHPVAVQVVDIPPGGTSAVKIVYKTS